MGAQDRGLRRRPPSNHNRSSVDCFTRPHGSVAQHASAILSGILTTLCHVRPPPPYLVPYGGICAGLHSPSLPPAACIKGSSCQVFSAQRTGYGVWTREMAGFEASHETPVHAAIQVTAKLVRREKAQMDA